MFIVFNKQKIYSYLVDMSKLRLELRKQKLFRINQEIDDINVKTKIICVYEYEAVNVEE